MQYFILILFLFIALPVFAVETFPENARPGVINRELNQEMFGPSTDKLKVEPEEVDVDDEELEPPADIKSPDFLLNEVIIKGNTVYSTDELYSYFEPFINDKVNFNILNDILTDITNLYRNDGYLTSFAYLPPQVIDDGIVEIGIIEGVIGDINISGQKWTRPFYIKNFVFRSNEIKKNKLFNINNINRAMGELNSKSYLKGVLVIEKGKLPKSTDLNVDIVKERVPIIFGAGWNNQGKYTIGKQRAHISTGISNLTGFGDSVKNQLSFSRGLFSTSSRYGLPVSPFGTTLNFSHSYTYVDIGGSPTLRNLDITGATKTYSLALVQPVYRGKNLEIISDLNFDAEKSINKFRGELNLGSQYRLRVLRAGINFKNTDKYGKTILRIESSKGFLIMGATEYKNWNFPSGEFFKVNSTIMRYHYLPFNLILVPHASVQYSQNILPASEKFFVGGFGRGSGHEESAFSGDLGYYAGLELLSPIFFLPKEIDLQIPFYKKLSIPIKRHFLFSIFYEQGYTNNVHNSGRNAFVQTVGTGIKVNIYNNLDANFYIGIPIGPKEYETQKDVKFIFNINSNVFR